MKINQNREGDKLVVVVEGRLDTTTAIDFEKAFEETLVGVSDLVLDMNGLEYISSAGLRVLLKLQKRMLYQGKMTLVGVNENVMEVLEITGFLGILNVE